MLVTREGKGWRPTTCNDEDDFVAVKQRAWSVEQDFQEGEPVELWKLDAEAPPRTVSEYDISGYARSGVVLKQKLRRSESEDPEVGGMQSTGGFAHSDS